MSDLVKKTDEFVFNLFKEKLNNTFIYHNYTHTKRVFKSAQEILENSDVKKKDAEVVQLAALLHDTGYIKKHDGHEEESVKIATEFLKDNKIDEETSILAKMKILLQGQFIKDDKTVNVELK